MKFKIGLFLLTAFSLMSCGSPDSSRKTSSGNAQGQGLRTEKVTCNGTTLLNYKNNNGSDDRQLQEWVTITSRNISSSNDGRSEVADSSGETSQNSYQYFSDTTKTYLSKFSFSYVSHRNTETTPLPDGTIKEISHTIMRRTGKDGSQFPDGSGGKKDNQDSEHTFETITRIDGDRVYDISIKIDGKVQPVHNYLNTSRTDNGIKISQTSLLTPFSETDNNEVIIIEKDDSICRIEIVK